MNVKRYLLDISPMEWSVLVGPEQQLVMEILVVHWYVLMLMVKENWSVWFLLVTLVVLMLVCTLKFHTTKIGFRKELLHKYFAKENNFSVIFLIILKSRITYVHISFFL